MYCTHFLSKHLDDDKKYSNTLNKLKWTCNSSYYKQQFDTTTLYDKYLRYLLSTFFWEWYIFTKNKVIYYSPNCVNPGCCYLLSFYNQEKILQDSSSLESFVAINCTSNCDFSSFNM